MVAEELRQREPWNLKWSNSNVSPVSCGPWIPTSRIAVDELEGMPRGQLSGMLACLERLRSRERSEVNSVHDKHDSLNPKSLYP